MSLILTIVSTAKYGKCCDVNELNEETNKN